MDAPFSESRGTLSTDKERRGPFQAASFGFTEHRIEDVGLSADGVRSVAGDAGGSDDDGEGENSLKSDISGIGCNRF